MGLLGILNGPCMFLILNDVLGGIRTCAFIQEIISRSDLCWELEGLPVRFSIIYNTGGSEGWEEGLCNISYVIDLSLFTKNQVRLETGVTN